MHQALKIPIFFFFCIAFLCPTLPSPAQVSPETIAPHELAYLKATQVLQAKALAFDPTRGILVEVTKVVRGGTKQGEQFYLQNTQAFSFLNRPGTPMGLFLDGVSGSQGKLWHGPTTGGLIWNDSTTLGIIAAAYENPTAALRSSSLRTQLAGAYFLGNRGVLKQTMPALAWGVGQDSPEINQTATDTLTSAGINLPPIIGPYHPGFRPEIKQQAAQKLAEWWLENSGR